MTIGEARFLEEFIIYHAALGFNQFYIYDQGTDQETAEVLAPYIASGLVTFTRVSNQSREHMFQALLLRCVAVVTGASERWTFELTLQPSDAELRPFEMRFLLSLLLTGNVSTTLDLVQAG